MRDQRKPKDDQEDDAGGKRRHVSVPSPDPVDVCIAAGLGLDLEDLFGG